jgi:hypothetical protein
MWDPAYPIRSNALTWHKTTVNTLKPNIPVNTTRCFRLTVFHIYLSLGKIHKTNIFFSIFKKIVVWKPECKRPLDKLHAAAGKATL